MSNDGSDNKVLEFLMTYGWAILVILVAVGALAYFGMFNKEQPQITETETIPTLEMYAKEVCNNLEKVVNNSLMIYPEIYKSKSDLEATWNFRVIGLDGRNITARQWDEEGVMCQMNVELCEVTYKFCMDVRMMIPVNYTEWNNWKEDKN